MRVLVLGRVVGTVWSWILREVVVGRRKLRSVSWSGRMLIADTCVRVIVEVRNGLRVVLRLRLRLRRIAGVLLLQSRRKLLNRKRIALSW